MNSPFIYQAKLAAPFGMVGVVCRSGVLLRVEFLPPETPPQAPVDALSEAVCKQILAYCTDANFVFDLPQPLLGTEHQRKVWRAMCAIPVGQTQYYSQLATQLHSSPRAIGQACGANPIPVVVPCHRVVAKSGMGGFMHHRAGYALDIKRWLLVHEAAFFQANSP